MSLITEEQPPGLLYLPTSPHSHSTSTREYERPVVTMTTTSPSQGQACNPKTSTVTGTICIVCNEVATKDTSFRKHYGVVCCEACKCFFRRTVQMSRDYKCRYDGKCMIGRYHDNMKQVCQACRFSQCIRAGMKIDSVKKFPRKGGGGGGGKYGCSGDIENGRQDQTGAKFQKVLKNFSKSKRKAKSPVGDEILSSTTTTTTTENDMKQEKDETEFKYSLELHPVLEPIPQEQLFSCDTLDQGDSKKSPLHTNGVYYYNNFTTASITETGGSGTCKRNSSSLQAMDAKKMRLEAAVNMIRPPSPSHLSVPQFSPPPLPQYAPYTPPSFQHLSSYQQHTYNSHHGSVVNSPESHPPSVYNSHTNTPYATPHATPHGTPIHSPLPSPTGPLPPHSATVPLQPYPPSSSLLTPISLPTFTRRNNLLLPQNPGTVFLNSTTQMPFRVLPVAQSILPFMASFPSFTQQVQTCNGDITAGPSPFSIVPIPSSTTTRISQLVPQNEVVDLPQPTLPPPETRCEVEESLASAPPSARTSPEPALHFKTSFISDGNTFPEAEVDEVLDSLRHRITTMFSWAKYDVAGFEDLSPLDQKALLRRTVAELVMLGFARASIAYDGVLLLGKTGKAIRPINDNSGVSVVASVTLKKLVEPLKVVNMDDREYSLLLEIVLFNPESSCLRNREVVRAHRKRSHISLKEYTDKHSTGDLGRFGELMCLLTPLFEVSTEVTEQLRLEHFVHEGEARIDALLLMSMINGAEEVGAT